MLIIAKNHTDSETWGKRWWCLGKMLRKWWKLKVGLVGFLLFTFYCIILTCLETCHVGMELGTKFHVSHFTIRTSFLIFILWLHCHCKLVCYCQIFSWRREERVVFLQLDSRLYEGQTHGCMSPPFWYQPVFILASGNWNPTA